MVGSIWLEGIVSQKSQTDERSAMESATAIATEGVVSIRTVQSLGNFPIVYNSSTNFAFRFVSCYTSRNSRRASLTGYIYLYIYCFVLYGV